MGRRQPVQSIGQRTPTFTNSQAFYNARGSDLDRLERYGPDRSNQETGLGGVTYGGRSVGAPSPSAIAPTGGYGNTIGNGIAQSAFGSLSTDDPYTSLTGDVGTTQSSPIMDSTPLGRYNRMSAEQAALAAEGLEAGRSAAAQVREVQNAVEAPALTQSPTPTGTGRVGIGRYGVGTVYPSGGGPSKSFGRFNSPTVEADRQAEIGERAIASRNRAGVSTASLANGYKRRLAEYDRLNRYSR